MNDEIVGDISSLDRRLLNILRENARVSVTDMAKALAVSRATAQEHMQRLERQGVIQGYTIKLSPEVEGRHVSALVMMSVNQKQLSVLGRKIGDIGAVTSLVSVSGEYDLVATLWEISTEALDHEIDRLSQLDGVLRTMTSIVLSKKIDR